MRIGTARAEVKRRRAGFAAKFPRCNGGARYGGARYGAVTLIVSGRLYVPGGLLAKIQRTRKQS